VEVELLGQDFLQQFSFQHTKSRVYQYPVGHIHAVTDGFRGSDYSGTFSLTKISETETSSSWQYTFPDNPPTCGAPYVLVTLTDGVFPGDTVIYAQLNIHGLRYVDLASTTPKSMSEFSCSLSNFTTTGDAFFPNPGTISGARNGLMTGSGAASRTCQDVASAVAFNVPIISKPVFPVFSDEAGLGGAYTTISESLPSDTSLYSPTSGGSGTLRNPLVKFLGLTVIP
jgi:hypothetical protein